MQPGRQATPTRGELIARDIRARSNHPAVLAAGLRPLLCALAEFVDDTERRLAQLEKRTP